MRAATRLIATLVAALALPLAAEAGPAGHGVAEHTVVAQHVRTDDVRSIAVLGDQVLAATGGGLAVHHAEDGAHQFTLTSQAGLPGNSLRAVTAVGPRAAIVGGDFGAAVVTLGDSARTTRVEKIAGTAPADVSHFAPITVVRGSVAPGCFTTGGACVVELLHQHRGLLEAERGSDGRWQALPLAPARPGPWAAAARTANGRLMGAFDGRLEAELPLRPSLTPIQALHATPDAVWIATGERLNRLVGDTQRPVGIGGRPLAATALGAGPGDAVLVGAVDGRVFRSRGAELEPLGRASGRITAVTADPTDPAGAWIGVAGSGLHRLRAGAVGVALRPAGEICSNHLAKLTRHRGVLIAGAFHRGACALGPDGWVDLPVSSPFVFGVASDGYYLWVASSGGIDRFGPDLEPVPYTRGDPRKLRWLPTTAATAAIEVAPGVVSIASGYGLVRITRRDDNRLKVRFTGHKSGAPYGVNSLAARGDDLIVGSEKSGITVMTGGNVPADRWQDPVHLPENWVVALDTAPDGTVWVGTCQEGAAAIGPDGQSRRVGLASGLPDRRVTAVAATADGAWVGTLGGVAQVTADGVRAYGTADGLPDPRSSALFVDGDTVWLGTEGGLARLEPASALAAR